MPINSDKPHLWKQDIAASVDQFNIWFMKFAPKAYRDTRVQTTKDVEGTLGITNDLAALTADVLKKHPGILPTLRMSLCPTIAREAEAQARRALKKHRSLQTTYSESLPFVLMLSGQIDAGVLGTLAAESLDWVWQHKFDQFAELIR